MTTRNIETREGYDFWDKLCAIPKYGFVIGPNGGVVKVENIGSWIDRDEAQRVVDDAQSEVNELRAEVEGLRKVAARWQFFGARLAAQQGLSLQEVEETIDAAMPAKEVV